MQEDSHGSQDVCEKSQSLEAQHLRATHLQEALRTRFWSTFSAEHLNEGHGPRPSWFRQCVKALLVRRVLAQKALKQSCKTATLAHIGGWRSSRNHAGFVDSTPP